MMEPIPYFYESINRNAMVIKPRQALLDWVNALDPNKPVTGTPQGTVYLVKERDGNQAIERWLAKNFDDIFQNELNNWYTDEKTWPAKRTYKQFKEWFEVEIHSMILDLEETKIVKE